MQETPLIDASPVCSDSSLRPSRGWPARLSVPVAAILLVDLALIAYYGSFRGVFLLDDIPHIIENPTIRSLPATLAQTGSGGRPLLFVSLAFNYAIGGLQPLSYHVFNFAVHALAGLTLFGIARRTLLRWNAAGGDQGPANEFASRFAEGVGSRFRRKRFLCGSSLPENDSRPRSHRVPPNQIRQSLFCRFSILLVAPRFGNGRERNSHRFLK